MHSIPMAAALLLVAPLAAQEYTRAEAIAEIAGQHVGKNKNVGIMVGIRDGKHRWTHGFGRVAKPDGAPPDERTLFEIGSITKVFNGILLADRVAERKVSLDDPLAKHLPSRVAVPAGESRDVSLLDLVTHRSGLPRMPPNFRPKDVQDPYVDYGVEQLYEAFEDIELATEPGEAYEYSNLATGLLGHVLARASETDDYAALLKRRVLDPLGLTSTGINFGQDSKRLASVYTGIGKPAKPWRFDVLAPAGAIRSSMADMLAFVDANLGLRCQEFQPILDAARRIRTESEPRVALGWHVLKIDETDVWWHNGGTGGSCSFVGIVPDQTIGVVVLSNSARSVDELAIKLLRLVLAR